MSGNKRTENFDGTIERRVWMVVARYGEQYVTWGPYFRAATAVGVHTALVNDTIGGIGYQGKPTSVSTVYHNMTDWREDRVSYDTGRFKANG